MTKDIDRDEPFNSVFFWLYFILNYGSIVKSKIKSKKTT